MTDAVPVGPPHYLFTRDGTPTLVPSCTYPLTGLACVDRLYTEHAVFDLGPGGAVLRETFGCSATDLMARLG